MDLSHQQYIELYGPTVGDRIRLADTNLILEVEQDLRASPGDELVYGTGKTARDGMGQGAISNADGAMDMVITNVTILDPVIGVVSADIGIKDGRIAGIGKAGNPLTMEGVTLICGPGTEVVDGKDQIATAGLIDPHVHMICPQQVWHALSNGITTMLGGGTGPADGTRGTTCTPGPWNIGRMLQAAEALPVNWGVWGKGNSSRADPLEEQVLAGACGFKVHEDWGATPAVIDAFLSVCDKFDIQALIHTDTLNESGFVQDTMAALKGRTIHTYHTEGAGGGHAPDIIAIAGLQNVLPSSTNPTRPFTINTASETFAMLVVTHHVDPTNPEDLAMAESRIRPETMAAEDVFHDLGILSMYSSDAQAMGRIGETFTRLIQTAHKMKEFTGKLPEDSARNDNFRVLRYMAKMTINPAIAHGLSHEIGSLQPGRMADIVLWPVRFFGAKPKMVIKGGMIAWSLMGDPNASIPTTEPVFYRPMFGALGKARFETSTVFLPAAAYERGVHERLGLQKRPVVVKGTRSLTKQDMIRNNVAPCIEVDPETYAVWVNGRLASVEAARTLPLTQRYFIV